jgi:hypothetical protein
LSDMAAGSPRQSVQWRKRLYRSARSTTDTEEVWHKHHQSTIQIHFFYLLYLAPLGVPSPDATLNGRWRAGC